MSADNPTVGEKAVGLNFNPSGDRRVTEVKQKFAELIDLMDQFRSTCNDSGAARHASIAITDMETAQMRAVKALTWTK